VSAIGVDTNVLLRLVLNDDLKRRAKALAFGESLTEESPGFVSLIVLMEFNWALGSRYRQPKERVLSTIGDLIKTETLVFESFDTVVRALEMSRHSRVDFSDALIAERSREFGCSHTVTFDQDAAANIRSMELLA
jgi:predicted nucleic-acid-binding protein